MSPSTSIVPPKSGAVGRLPCRNRLLMNDSSTAAVAEANGILSGGGCGDGNANIGAAVSTRSHVFTFDVPASGNTSLSDDDIGGGAARSTALDFSPVAAGTGARAGAAASGAATRRKPKQDDIVGGGKGGALNDDGKTDDGTGDRRPFGEFPLARGSANPGQPAVVAVSITTAPEANASAELSKRDAHVPKEFPRSARWVAKLAAEEKVVAADRAVPATAAAVTAAAGGGGRDVGSAVSDAQELLLLEKERCGGGASVLPCSAPSMLSPSSALSDRSILWGTDGHTNAASIRSLAAAAASAVYPDPFSSFDDVGPVAAVVPEPNADASAVGKSSDGVAMDVQYPSLTHPRKEVGSTVSGRPNEELNTTKEDATMTGTVLTERANTKGDSDTVAESQGVTTAAAAAAIGAMSLRSREDANPTDDDGVSAIAPRGSSETTMIWTEGDVAEHEFCTDGDHGARPLSWSAGEAAEAGLAAEEEEVPAACAMPSTSMAEATTAESVEGSSTTPEASADLGRGVARPRRRRGGVCGPIGAVLVVVVSVIAAGKWDGSVKSTAYGAGTDVSRVLGSVHSLVINRGLSPVIRGFGRATEGMQNIVNEYMPEESLLMRLVVNSPFRLASEIGDYLRGLTGRSQSYASGTVGERQDSESTDVNDGNVDSDGNDEYDNERGDASPQGPNTLSSRPTTPPGEVVGVLTTGDEDLFRRPQASNEWMDTFSHTDDNGERIWLHKINPPAEDGLRRSEGKESDTDTQLDLYAEEESDSASKSQEHFHNVNSDSTGAAETSGGGDYQSNILDNKTPNPRDYAASLGVEFEGPEERFLESWGQGQEVVPESDSISSQDITVGHVEYFEDTVNDDKTLLVDMSAKPLGSLPVVQRRASTPHYETEQLLLSHEHDRVVEQGNPKHQVIRQQFPEGRRYYRECYSRRSCSHHLWPVPNQDGIHPINSTTNLMKLCSNERSHWWYLKNERERERAVVATLNGTN